MSSPLDILILGGSGFLSGTLSRLSVERGHHVTILTRGERAVPTGMQALRVDRKNRDAFAATITGQNKTWDLVVDCIGMEPDDARQDIALFSSRAKHFVFVSTDFVYDPPRRRIPQAEEPADYLTEGYGGRKRQCEELLLATPPQSLPWTIFRPGHIYGPGSLLGCLPLHGRDPELINRLKRREPLQLIEGGRLRQQPIFAGDLADTILSVPFHSAAGQLLNVSGPDVVQSRRYYEIIADILGVPLTVEEVSMPEFLSKNPDKAPFCCERVYNLSRLHQTGLNVPATRLEDGLRQHVESLL